MSKSLTFAGDMLKLVFNATPIANLADNAASSPFTNLYVALHLADPGPTGTQSTNEISYTGYARVAVVRTSSGWVVTGLNATLVAAILFAKSTGGTGGTALFASVGVAASGAGKVLYRCSLSPPIVVATGSTPEIAAGSAVVEA